MCYIKRTAASCTLISAETGYVGSSKYMPKE